MDKRQTTAAVMFLIGLLLVVGTFGKYEFNGYITAGEFLGKIGAGLALMMAALPVSGDLDELYEQPEKRKNRR